MPKEPLKRIQEQADKSLARSKARRGVVESHRTRNFWVFLAVLVVLAAILYGIAR